jgi:hypothetical protein
VRDHRESDLADDRYHYSEATLVPAIVVIEDGVPVTKFFRGAELVVWLGRYDGDLLEWIVIEPTEGRTPSLVLTAESARLMARAVELQLGQAHPASGNEQGIEADDS